MRLIIWCFATTLMTGQILAQVASGDKEEAKERIDRQRALIRSFERDPQAFRDSLAAVRKKLAETEGIRRVERYRKNTRVDTLTEINLSNARLSAIPDFVLLAENLKVLKIENNQISKLPRKLRKLDSLQKIYWSGNETGGRIRIPRLAGLRDLRLNDDGLENVPNFRKLKSLERLELSKNKLSAIPIAKLRGARSLEEVVMKENPLIIGEGRYDKLGFIKVLKLNKCGLTSIHPSLYTMENLHELQLQENKLKSIPDGISNMSKLTKLSLYKNQLQALPTDLFDIPGLVVVDLYYNRLTKVPSSVRNAVAIEILFLSHNEIYDIPEEVGMLTRLEELYLHHNRISVLPASLSQLSELRVLRVNHNHLSDFPEQILKLRNLTDLDIEDNYLTAIPAKIGNLPKLGLFTYDGNQIDFNAPENGDLAKTIHEMTQRGVICKPEISLEHVDEEGNVVTGDLD